MNVDELTDFVTEAVANGWPANTLPRDDAEFPNFYGGGYERGRWRYADLWSGATTDAGMMTVFYDESPIWICTYRGGIFAGDAHLEQNSIESNDLFNFLVTALRTERTEKFKLRGPARTTSSDNRWLYTFKMNGDIEAFIATEQISDRGELVYERVLLGGRVGDGVAYSNSSLHTLRN